MCTNTMRHTASRRSCARNASVSPSRTISCPAARTPYPFHAHLTCRPSFRRPAASSSPRWRATETASGPPRYTAPGRQCCAHPAAVMPAATPSAQTDRRPRRHKDQRRRLLAVALPLAPDVPIRRRRPRYVFDRVGRGGGRGAGRGADDGCPAAAGFVSAVALVWHRLQRHHAPFAHVTSVCTPGLRSDTDAIANTPHSTSSVSDSFGPAGTTPAIPVEPITSVVVLYAVVPLGRASDLCR